MGDRVVELGGGQALQNSNLILVELTDAEILAIWESLSGEKTLVDFARACIAASFKQ